MVRSGTGLLVLVRMVLLAAIPVRKNLVDCPMQFPHDSPPHMGQLRWLQSGPDQKVDVLPNPKVRVHASLISRSELLTSV